MTAVSCLVAAADLDAEPELVRTLQEQGVHVVRRCLDAADLLAAASLDARLPVVLGAGVPRLTRECIQRLQLQERLVIGVGVTPAHEELLRDWGVHEVVPAREPAQAGADIAARLVGAAAVPARGPRPGVWTLAARQPAPPRVGEPVLPLAPQQATQAGVLVTVWGPSGAPGRSTTALAIGAALGSRGHDVLVIDADVVEPSLALLAGLVDDAGGISLAERSAVAGRLTPGALRRLAQPVAPGCSVLSGLGGPGRWRALRPESFARVLDVARACSTSVIVDIAAFTGEPAAAGLLDDDAQAVAMTALQASDAVVAVGRADDLGVARLLIGCTALRALHVEPAVFALTPSAAQDAMAAAASAVRTCSPGIPVVALERASATDALSARALRGRGLVRRRPATGIAQVVGAIESVAPAAVVP